FLSSRRRHTIFSRDWSSDVCSSDLVTLLPEFAPAGTFSIAVTTDLNDLYGKALHTAAQLSYGFSAGERPEIRNIHKLVDGQVIRSEERRAGRACRGTSWLCE